MEHVDGIQHAIISTHCHNDLGMATANTVQGVLNGARQVEVTINGKKEITSIKLAEEIVDPEDIETLQDAIVAAANEALRKADEANAELMGKMTGGLGGFPF